MTEIIEQNKIRGNYPNLRFPEFEGEWRSFLFAEIATIKGGFAFDSKTLSSERKKYQIIKMGNLYQNQLNLDRTPSFIDVIDDRQRFFLLKKNDIVITLTGTNNKQDYGYSYLFKSEDNLLLNQRCALIRAKYDSHFLSYLIKTRCFLEQFFQSSAGGTGNQANVSTKDIENFIICTPSPKEQEKIGKFLSLLEQRIETQIKIIEKYESLIKGIIDYHFKNSNHQDYSIKELGEYFNVMSLSKENLSENGEKCILYGELFTTYGCVINEIKSRTIIKNGVKLTLSSSHDLLFPSSTTVDAYSLISPSAILEEGVILGGDMFGIRINKKFNNEYLSYLFNYLYKIELAKYAKGSTIIHLHYNEIKNAKIGIPSLEEQNKAAMGLKLLQEKLFIGKNLLSTFQKQREYFLKQMFI